MATLAEIYKAAGMLPPITDPSKASLPLNPPKPSTKPTDRTWGEVATDTLKQAASGVGGLVQTVGDLQMLIDANLPTLSPRLQVGDQNALQDIGGVAQKYWGDQYSPAYKEQEKIMQAAIDAKAKKEGEIAGFVETLNQLKENPSHAVGKIIESAPQFLPGVGVAKGVTAMSKALKYAPEVAAKLAGSAAVSTGVIQQASSVGGDVMRDLNKDTFLSQDEKENRASMAALEAGLISAATTMIPGANILEKSLAGGGSGARSRLVGAGLGLVGQGAQEVVEEGSGKAFTNVYTGKDDTLGVGSAIANGLITGAPMGAMAGIIAPPSSTYKPNTIDTKVAETIASHEANQQTIMDNALMQTNGGEKFDVGANDPITETIDMPEMVVTPPVVDHREMFGAILGEDLDAARAEHDTVIYPKVMEMAQAGAKPEQISAYLDNAITPTRDDLSLSESINGGEMMASRLSGMRIMDVLERSIKTSVEAPDIARTNEEVKTYLKKNGVGKELSNAFVKAYATKDPSILHEHILKNTELMQAEVKNQIDTRLTEYAALKEQQKAAQWESSVPPEAVDLVTHPKFLEHLNERADVSAADTRYAQTRTADLVLSHENNGKGYETVVQQPAMFDRNYAYDFELTKKDVSDIKAGKWSEPLIEKLRNDLERRDNDPLYNPEKNIETIVNDSETLSQKLYREMSDVKGTEEADASMAIVEGRAKAMGITPDELIAKHPVEVRDMTHMDGVEYVRDSSSEYLFQKSDSEIKQEVDTAIHRALNDRNSDGKVEFGTLSDDAVKFIKTHTGVDLRDYQVILHDVAIRHMQRDHAVDIPLLKEMMSVVRDFDNVRKSIVINEQTGRPETFIEFYKKMDDGVIKSVEFRDFNNKQLSMKTFYKMDSIKREDQRLPRDLRLSPQYEKTSRPAGSTSETQSDGFNGSKATDTESLQQKIPDVKLIEDQINGMIERGITSTGEMKAIITLFKTADASTLPHELMHWMEKTLSDVERAAVDDILKDYEAGTPRSEALARLFEKYLAEGNAPTPELKNVFEKFRDWMAKLWESVVHDKNSDFTLTDAHRDLYRALLGDSEAGTRLAERYEGIVNEKIAAEAEVLFQKSSVDSRNALQKMNDTYDGVIDTVDKAITDFARGVDKNGDVIIRTPSEYPIADKAVNMLDWVREAFITNGRKSDTLVDMAHEFDNVRGYLSDEAKALRDLLKGYDKVQIVDPLQSTNLLEQDAPPRMTTHGALLVRALGGDLPLSMLPESMHIVYAQMRKVIDDNTKALIDAGELSPEHAKENYLKRYYMEHITNKNLGSGKITQTGKHARSELDLDTRLDMGQIEDAAFVITRTMLDQRLQLEKVMYFKKLSDKFGVNDARDGYEQISKKTADDGKTPLYGALAGKYVPKFVADELKGAYEVGSWVDSVVKGLAVPVDFIKVTQTVKNPGTHVYNVTSNTYIAYMDGHLTDVAEIAMMIKKNPQKFREITRAASKEGLNGMGVDLEKSILKANTDGKGLTIIKNLLLAQDSKAGEFTRNAYDWEDKIFKLAKFYSEMKKNGGKLDDATAKQYMSEVHKIYVDHAKPVPKFIRNMDKSGLSPFLSYVWRSAPQVAYVTLKHPLRFAAFHAVLAPFGASAIWNAIGGDDEDESGKPKYMKEGGFNMMGIENFLNTGTDENGYDSYVNLGRAAPGMRFMPDKGNPLLLYSDGGFTTDILRTVFTGESNKGEIYTKSDSNTEKTLKMTAALAEYVLPPVLPIPAIPVIMGDKIGESGTKQLEKDGTVKQETVSIGGRYAQKLNQALLGKRDTYGQPVTVGDVVSQAVGMKVTRIDPEVEKEKRYKEWMPEVKRAINEGDMERAKEYADKIKELDLQEKKRGEKDPKKEAQKENKKNMDRELQKLGLQKPKSSIGFKMPHVGPPSLKF